MVEPQLFSGFSTLCYPRSKSDS